jgi:hypothetical protein
LTGIPGTYVPGVPTPTRITQLIFQRAIVESPDPITFISQTKDIGYLESVCMIFKKEISSTLFFHLFPIAETTGKERPKY